MTGKRKQLLRAVIETSIAKPNYKAIAQYIGEGKCNSVLPYLIFLNHTILFRIPDCHHLSSECTPKAAQNRLDKLRRVGRESPTKSTPNPKKRKGVDDENGDESTNTDNEEGNMSLDNSPSVAASKKKSSSSGGGLQQKETPKKSEFCVEIEAVVKQKTPDDEIIADSKRVKRENFDDDEEHMFFF
jgi:hypothetical protein